MRRVRRGARPRCFGLAPWRGSGARARDKAQADGALSRPYDFANHGNVAVWREPHDEFVRQAGARADRQFGAGPRQIDRGAFQERRAIAEIDPGRTIDLGSRRWRCLFHTQSPTAFFGKLVRKVRDVHKNGGHVALLRRLSLAKFENRHPRKSRQPRCVPLTECLPPGAACVQRRLITSGRPFRFHQCGLY